MSCHRFVFSTFGNVTTTICRVLLGMLLVMVASVATAREAGKDFKDENWTLVKPDNGNFTVKMPARPNLLYDAQPLGNQLVESIIYEVRAEAGEVIYTATCFDLSEVPPKERDLARLSKLLPQPLDNAPSYRHAKQKDVKRGGLPGIARTGAVDSQQRVTEQVFLDGSYFYRLRVISTPDHANDPEIAHFFKSLKLLKKK